MSAGVVQSKVTPSAALGPDGKFDESKLAKPADWAALDDFDEEEIIAEMTKRVDETWLSTKFLNSS